ncbi:MAG: response regulator [Phycisphaerae bacterium]|jgi:signal transduction histidine kinase/ActR/RegA family two-component response regulator|nr:response regulator [Phycisphaerae bacterium]
MNIRTKLTLAFLSVVLLVAMVGYHAVSISETALQAGIGEQSAVRAREMLARIDASIYARIEQLRAYAEQLAEAPTLIASNRKFEGLDDRKEYIAEKDRAWQAAQKGRITPFMADLINNQLSQGIRRGLEQKGFYRVHLGYELFSEVFVTNKYGANVAQTQKTSDYYQGDEVWWQEARTHGLYVADVQYDKSAEVYSTDICVRVEDKEGSFLGVLKAVVNLEAVISCLKDADESKTAEFKLLTADYRVIYFTEEHSILEPLPEGLPFEPPHRNAPNWMNYFIAEGDTPGKDEELYAFARSSGFRDYEGLNWVLLVEHDRKAILAPVAMLRNRVLGVLLAATVLAVISGMLISRSVANSLKDLTGAAVRIGEGDLSVRVEIRSRDEVGQLTSVFNEMAANLQSSRDDVEREVTDRKRAEAQRLSLERQVQYAQKLESLGILAGGVAHDFNNILMVILGNADLAMDGLSSQAPARENIAEILKASKRAAELASQMLAYSGKGRFVVEPVDLGMLVDEMAHLLEVSISKKVALKYNFADNLPAIDGDATQIRQIIMNLITNASESIGDTSGVVALSTGVMDCDRAYLDGVNEILLASLDEPLPEGLYVYLEVADTGCGMDAETTEKIFDPFFTTKFTGRGLGMSAVLGIVRGHHGAINICSELGKGTTFKVFFPASELSAVGEETQDRDADQAEAWRGRGTVLVADDEKSICATIGEALGRMGFSVLTAADGREAVEIFGAHSDEIVCVLLDLTMPRMDGEQAFGELRRICPEVRVVLCSGYNEQDATQHFVGKGLAGFIQKPYDLSAMREKLMEILPDNEA